MRLLASLLLASTIAAAAADPRGDAMALYIEVSTLAPQLAALSATPPAEPAEAANQITVDIIMPLFAATDSWTNQVTINGAEPYQPYADCLTAAEALAEQANKQAMTFRGMSATPAGPDDDAPFKAALAACEKALGPEPAAQ